MNIMPSGFGASEITEIASISTGEGSRFAGHYDGSGVASLGSSFQGASELIAGANLWGHEYATAEANNNDARLAIFGTTTSSHLISTSPYMGTYHFADTNSTSRAGRKVEVHPHHTYYAFVYAKSVNVSYQSRTYLGFRCYDQDGTHIRLDSGGGLSHTTLSQDLEDGDSYFEVTDASTFSTGGAAGTRYVLLYPPNHTKHYRPYYYGALLDSGGKYYSARDTGNNRLRISSNGDEGGSGDTTWSGGFVPAGTAISRGQHGGTYMYCLASNALVPYTYTHYDNKINTLRYGVRGSGCHFRPGTKYITTMGLHNRANNGEQMYLDNYYLTNLTDPGQVDAGTFDSTSKKYLQNHKFGPRFDKSGGVECTDLNEIIIPGHGGVFSYGNSIYKSTNLKIEIDPEDATCRGGITSSSGAGIKAAGGTLEDLSGNNNDITIEGNPFMGYGTSKHDGTGDNLYRSTPSWTDYFTFGCWIYIADDQDNNGVYWFNDNNRGSTGHSARIFSDIVSGSGNDDVIRFKGWDNGAHAAGSGGTFTVSSTSAINDGVWHYITCVWDKTSKRIYFDGRLENSTTQNGSVDGAYSSLSVGGIYYNSAVQNSLTGHIGPFHMYTNEVLTDDQIYHNYNYFWEKRYKWLSDSTIKTNMNKDFGSMTFDN